MQRLRRGREQTPPTGTMADSLVTQTGDLGLPPVLLHSQAASCAQSWILAQIPDSPGGMAHQRTQRPSTEPRVTMVTADLRGFLWPEGNVGEKGFSAPSPQECAPSAS